MKNKIETTMYEEGIGEYEEGEAGSGAYTAPNWFFDLICDKTEGNKVLEVGSGRGFLSKKLEERGFNTVACDISEDRLKVARERASLVIQCDAQALPFKEGVFDMVVSIELMEHLDDPSLFLKEIFRVLKKDGILFIKTPNRLTHDLFQFLRGRLQESREWHPSVMTHTKLGKLLDKENFEYEFFKGNILKKQIEKVGDNVSSSFNPFLKIIPFQYLPLGLQTSIYCLATKA